MVGADAPSQAGRVVRAMGGDTRTSSRYDLSLGSPDLADSTDVTPIVMGHNPFTRGAAAAPPATDSEAMEGSQSAEGAQASRNCMDDGVQQTVKALEHLPSDFYFSSETDSPTLGVESRAPLDMSEYELSPNRFDCGDDCSVEELRVFDGDNDSSMLMGIDEEAAYRSAWGSGTPGASYDTGGGGFSGFGGGADENTPPSMFNTMMNGGGRGEAVNPALLAIGRTPDYKGPEFKPGRLASLMLHGRGGGGGGGGFPPYAPGTPGAGLDTPPVGVGGASPKVWRRGEGGGRSMMEGGGGCGVGVLTGTPALMSHALLSEPTPSALGPRGLMSARKSMQRQQVQVNVEEFEGGIPLDKHRKARMEAFGAQSGLPTLQKVILWYGVFSDILAKVSLVRELSRFGSQKDWGWFFLVFTFFVLSGCLTCAYWLSHYPKPTPPDPKEAVREVFGYRKYDIKVLLRRMGMICACFQLGTAFAALRTLRSDRPDRQRRAYMEMRGMRLVDTVFLTLSVASLQCYIGMRCSSELIHCEGREGFDAWLAISVSACMISAAACYISFDLKEGARPHRDLPHIIDICLAFVYHVSEVSARVVTIGLFATAAGSWVFLVFLCHALTVTALLRFPLVPELSHIWGKLNRMEQVTVRGCTLWLPALDDVKLLWACLVWPIPSYVSDATSAGSATSPGGQFWWRVPLRECGKLSFSSLRLEEGVVAFPCFIGIQAVEAVVMLSYVTHKLMLSDQNLLGLNLMWLIAAVMWMGTEFILRPPPPQMVGGPAPYREGMRGSICPPSTVRRGGGGMQSMARFEMEVSRSLLCESTIRELGRAGPRIEEVGDIAQAGEVTPPRAADRTRGRQAPNPTPKPQPISRSHNEDFPRFGDRLERLGAVTLSSEM